jgi:hypothetical protein
MVTAAVSLVVVGLAMVSVIQHQAQVKLRDENQALRQQDGTEKEFRLHVAQDSKSQRWIFKGGF